VKKEIHKKAVEKKEKNTCKNNDLILLQFITVIL